MELHAKAQAQAQAKTTKAMPAATQVYAYDAIGRLVLEDGLVRLNPMGLRTSRPILPKSLKTPRSQAGGEGGQPHQERSQNGIFLQVTGRGARPQDSETPTISTRHNQPYLPPVSQLQPAPWNLSPSQKASGPAADGFISVLPGEIDPQEMEPTSPALERIVLSLKRLSTPRFPVVEARCDEEEILV